MPSDRPRSGELSALEREAGEKGEATLKRPQIITPTGGGTGNYQGGDHPARQEAKYPSDGPADSGTDLASTHQEGRQNLPAKDSAGGASQLDRGTSLTSKTTS